MTDRLEIEPRVRITEPLVAFAVQRVFAHRHRRLRRRFGDATRGDPVEVGE